MLLNNTTQKKYTFMKTLTANQEIELNEIFNSDIFGLLDIESEKSEIEKLGWNYENLLKFGQALAEKIK